ncbi:hypothetical protein [Pararhodobacter sp.]|uniref:hypothetical protein n=1 Tax=Pararhodobacter sp. TaxID=2127056 RepID=UPI002FE1D618
MIRRALPLVTGAALAAGLVLCLVAMLQSWQLHRLRPPGHRTEAVVLIADLRGPDRETPWPRGEVRLFISDSEAGTFTASLNHPPASLTEVWAGGTVAVAVTPGDPPQVAFWPVIPEARRRVTLLALALTLALAAVSGLADRLMRSR